MVLLSIAYVSTDEGARHYQVSPVSTAARDVTLPGTYRATRLLGSIQY